jgi:hypothetical protein
MASRESETAESAGNVATIIGVLFSEIVFVLFHRRCWVKV